MTYSENYLISGLCQVISVSADAQGCLLCQLVCPLGVNWRPALVVGRKSGRFWLLVTVIWEVKLVQG